MIKKHLLTSLSIIVLNACTSSPIDKVAYYPLPQLTYEHLTEIPVQTKTLEFNSHTQRGAQAWDIADELITPADVAMQRYLKQRYKAVGRDGVFKIDLLKAEIRKDSVPNNNRMLSYISLANIDEYTFEIIVGLESRYNSGLPDRKTSTRFVRHVRMPLNATLAYREALLQKTMEEILVDIDDAISSALVEQFELVRAKDVPVHDIAVKTELPEIETEMGQKMNNIHHGIHDAKQSVEDQLGDTVIKPAKDHRGLN